MPHLEDRQYRSQFYPAVDQRQAIDDRQSQYYVPIYERPELAALDLVRELSDAIDFSAGESVHLVSGFRGSGKTSELLRLVDALDASGRPVVYMDIGEFINTELPLDFASFPVLLAAGFASAAGLGEVVRRSVSERFLSFMRRIKVEPTVALGTSGISTQFKASWRDDVSFVHRVSEAVSSNRRTFRDELHQFFAAASDAINPKVAPVFIVDSIDHFRGRAELFETVRQSVDRTFSEMVDELRLPAMHVLYTVPIYVQSPLGVKHEVLNVKVAEPDGRPYEPGLAAMRDVLARRAPDGDIGRLTGTDVDRLARSSGGLFRDLLRLTGQLIQSSRHLPATPAEFTRAETVLRSDFEGTLSAEKIEILRRVAATHRLTPRNEEWSDATDLMSVGAILKYPNGERAWYGVHPLLRPLLTD